MFVVALREMNFAHDQKPSGIYCDLCWLWVRTQVSYGFQTEAFRFQSRDYNGGEEEGIVEVNWFVPQLSEWVLEHALRATSHAVVVQLLWGRSVLFLYLHQHEYLGFCNT